jgi:hypothetical protein
MARFDRVYAKIKIYRIAEPPCVFLREHFKTFALASIFPPAARLAACGG